MHAVYKCKSIDLHSHVYVLEILSYEGINLKVFINAVINWYPEACYKYMSLQSI